MRFHVSDEPLTNARRRNAVVPRVLDRVALSLMVGFVATIIITGLSSVSTTQIYSTSPCRVFYIQNTSSGFPLDWFHLTYPSGGYGSHPRCSFDDLRVLEEIPKTSASVDLASFGLDVLLYSLMLLPLTRVSRGAPRLSVGSKREASLQNLEPADTLRLHELVVIAACVLSLVWMILYGAGIAGYVLLRLGFARFSSEAPFELSIIVQLSLYFSIAGILGSLWSTWRYVTGGILLACAGFFLLSGLSLIADMFVLNPEFGMLYVLWASTMFAGGLGAILAGLHRAYVRRELSYKGHDSRPVVVSRREM